MQAFYCFYAKKKPNRSGWANLPVKEGGDFNRIAG